MSGQQLSQSFEDDCSLSDFDSAGLSLCMVSEMENFTGHSNLESQSGSVETVEANECVHSVSHESGSHTLNCLPSVPGDKGEGVPSHDSSLTQTSFPLECYQPNNHPEQVNSNNQASTSLTISNSWDTNFFNRCMHSNLSDR